MTNRLTLAEGPALWNETGGYQDEGRQWRIRWEEDRRFDLKPEIEAWCVANLPRPYKVRLDPAHGPVNQQTTSLVIEFEHHSDMLMFYAMWGDA